MIHCLAPVMRPSAQRVRIALASEPEPGLGQRERPDLLAGGERRHVAATPWSSSGSVHALVCTATVTPTPASARDELLEHEHVGEEVRARAAVLLGDADAHQPELAERGEQLAREACGRGPTRRRSARSARRRSAARGSGSPAARRSARAGSCARPRARREPAPPAPRRRRARRATRSRRPSRSKRRISQPSSRATRASSESGLTATGWPTARSIGRSDSESEYAQDAARSMPSRAASSRIACALPSR